MSSDELTGSPNSESPCDNVVEEFNGLLDGHQDKPRLVAEFCNRFPECEEEIRATFEHQQRLDNLAERRLHKNSVPLLPESFGDFRQVHKIAEGGMGFIYKARQESLQRWVAIKTLSNPHARARFENEKRCLAQFNSAAIVALYEAGEWEGIPYLVMPFIEGATLSRVIVRANRQLIQQDSRGLSSTVSFLASDDQDVDEVRANDRSPAESHSAKLSKSYLQSVARCVGEIARAMQESHNRDIIHRDLKPENVMVNGSGHAFVIDFGLASPLDPGKRPTSIWDSTENFEQLIASGVFGTPQYMAPEQFAGEYGRETDVWGIGTILYELLTFAPAFSDTKRENPSTSPRSVSPGVPKDLDAVAMKCLELNRGNRYASAKEVAEDLERWMQHVPVVARPPAITERLGKWSRRHPALAVTVVLVLIGLVGLLAYSRQLAKVNTQLSEKQGELERAVERIGKEKEETERERNKAVKLSEANRVLAEKEMLAREELQVEFERAQQNLDMARQAVDELTRAATRLPIGPKLDPEQRRLFETSLGFYRQFLEQQEAVTPAIQFMAAVHFGLVARRQHDAFELAEAEKNYQHAAGLLIALADNGEGDPKYEETLAGTYLNLANLFADTGRGEEAEAVYQKCLGLFTQLVEDHPNEPGYAEKLAGFYNNRGELLREASKLEESEKALREAIRLHNQLDAANSDFRFSSAVSLTNLALTLQADKRYDEAEALYNDALVRLQQLPQAEQANRDVRQELARCYHNRGNLWLDHGRPAEALKDLAQAIDLLHGLIKQFPTRVEYERELARVENSRAAAWADSGDAKEAVVAFQRSIAIRKGLATRFPDASDLLGELAVVYFNLGITLEQSDQLPGAARAFGDALERYLALVDIDPTLENRRNLADVSNSLGNVLTRLGQIKQAEVEYNRAVSILRELADERPEDFVFRRELARALYNFAAILQDTKRIEAAEANYDEAIKVFSELVQDDKKNPDFVHELASCHANRALLFIATGQAERASDDWEESHQLLKQLVEQFGDNTDYRRSLALACQNLGGWHADQGNLTEALELIEACIEHHREVLKSAKFIQRRYLTNLHSAYLKRAHIQIRLNDYRGALGSAEELPKLIPDQWPPYRFAAGIVASCIPLIEADRSIDKKEREQLAEGYAGRAVGLLKSAIRSGFQDFPSLDSAADLAPLRNHEGFQQLLQTRND